MATKNDNTGRIILVITGILVLTALAYFATKYFAQKDVVEEQQTTIDNLGVEIDQLEAQIVEFESTIQDQQTDINTKDSLLSVRNGQLEALEVKLQRYKRSSNANAKKLSDLESRITQLRSQVTEYQQKVETLEETIAEQSDSLAQQLAISEDQQAQISNLSQTAEEQAERLKRAGVLQAADFNFYNVKKNGKEDQDNSFRRSAIHIVKVCFNVLKNSEATVGKRDVYLVVENPDGSVNANAGGGYSGEFVFNGSKRTYSAKTNIDYKLTTQTVCIPYQPTDGVKFEKGDHFVSAFADGKLIGQGKFSVK